MTYGVNEILRNGTVYQDHNNYEKEKNVVTTYKNFELIGPYQFSAARKKPT